MSPQPENVITAELVRILNRMSPRWKLEQHQRPFLGSQKNPDIFITRPGYEPVAIEAKYVDSPDDVVAQAQKHVGQMLETEYATQTETLHTVMAIRYPARFKDVAGRDIEEKLRHAPDLQYLLTGKSGGETYQFPRNGWATGTVADIANAVHVGTVPSERIDEAAAQLERAVNIAAQRLNAAVKARAAIGDRLEHILHQERGTQTSRMACLILTDAFVFQSSLAGKNLKALAGDNPAALKALEHRKPVRSLGQHLRHMDFADVLTDWETLLKVNYQPIFADAMQMVTAIAADDVLINELLRTLCQAANDLVKTRLAQIHELAGEVFQKLIVDRKYVKANYTLPTSAALLSTLVCPELPDGRLPKVADFACGTGSLLNGVYKRVQRLYEQQGNKDSADIHKAMLEDNLAGSDIMPNATHLTFASLASAQPEIPLGATRIVTAPYGKQPNESFAVGALELLDEELLLPMMDTEAVQLGGEESAAVEIKRMFRNGEMDIVIQNPPFWKHSADANTGVPKVSFQGTQTSEEEKKELQRALKRKETRVAHGTAGHHSYFVELADKKLKNGGTMGVILPATILASASMQKVRDMWATEYHNISVLTITGAKGTDNAFSADTQIAECIVVATKGISDNTGVATFVSLTKRPNSLLEATEVANQILRRGTEDTVNIGEDELGKLVTCPILVGNTWGATRIKTLSVLETAHKLADSMLSLPRHNTPIRMPMARVGDIAVVGYTHPMIKGKDGAFQMAKGYEQTSDGYPAIWVANCTQQRAMVVFPDSHAKMRTGKEAQAQRILERSSRVHYYQSPTFSATSAIAMFTEEPSIGASEITNVAFQNPRYEIAWTLWCNSTLGLVCHWMHSTKQQASRGRLTSTTLKTLPTLDVRQLSDEALTNAAAIFERLKYQRMLPLNECARDEIRHELDAALLTGVLGIDDIGVLASMQTLREMLCAEPSIHGGKQSTCDLDAELEKLSAQGIVLPGMTAATSVREQAVLELTSSRPPDAP